MHYFKLEGEIASNFCRKWEQIPDVFVSKLVINYYFNALKARINGTVWNSSSNGWRFFIVCDVKTVTHRSTSFWQFTSKCKYRHVAKFISNQSFISAPNISFKLQQMDAWIITFLKCRYKHYNKIMIWTTFQMLIVTFKLFLNLPLWSISPSFVIV